MSENKNEIAYNSEEKECEQGCDSCTHDCSTCSKAGKCSNEMPAKLQPNKNSKIKKIIGVVSGKGGVGKSFVSGTLACKLASKGKKIGILDADVTGPSIPKMFGLSKQLEAVDNAIIPAETSTGIKVVSTNLILEEQSNPVAWRGPVVSGAIQQFFNQVNWGDLDVLIIDMPPGTSDVFLTIMQMIPVDGIVSVSTPQDLVGMIVGKAIKLAEMMNVPVISCVENMSYFKCDECGKKHSIFGSSQISEIAGQYGIRITDTLPINPNFGKNCDAGKIEELDFNGLLDNTLSAI